MFTHIFLTLMNFLGAGTPCEDEPNPKADPRSKLLHPPNPGNHHGRCVALRLHLYSALLYTQFNVVSRLAAMVILRFSAWIITASLYYLQGEPDVLHVWFPVPRLCYSGDYVFGDHPSALLLPFMCGGKDTGPEKSVKPEWRNFPPLVFHISSQRSKPEWGK